MGIEYFGYEFGSGETRSKVGEPFRTENGGDAERLRLRFSRCAAYFESEESLIRFSMSSIRSINALSSAFWRVIVESCS